MKDSSRWDVDEEKEELLRHYEFDCPECDANNPYPDGFGSGAEIRCFYCGNEYLVEVSEGGKWKFRMM